MKTILLSRTDKIGDVILTLPMAGMIKKHLPDSKVLFLARGYIKDVAARCVHIDKVYDWDQIKEGAEILPHIDYFFHVFPCREISEFAKSQKINHRIGTGHRVYHWWTCNHLVNFSRKRSDLHESQLNMKLLRPLGIIDIPDLSEMPELVGWKRSGRNKLQLGTGRESVNKFNLIFHMKSMGSAKEWPSANFLQLAKELPAGRLQIFVTGTAAEGKVIRNEISEIFTLPNVTDMTGRFDLNNFISFIEQCDGLLACSTGPLHIASISGLKTIGLYPATRPMHAGRWAPIGQTSQIISEPEQAKDSSLNIDTNNVKKIIESWIR